MADQFVWRDAGRVVVFRRVGLGGLADTLEEYGFGEFELLSTERALTGAEAVRDRAAAVHLVAAGRVADVSAGLLDEVGAERLVALGGGRVVDTAKAIASVTGARVAAVPTTMSGAEMTGSHRTPAGAEARIRGLVRPELVIADPDLMTGAPEPDLRASSMNALAHGADSLYTPMANPVSRTAGVRGAHLIASALDAVPEKRDVTDLAFGSVLCGYAIDSAGFAIHHVICQTLVQVCGSPHAQTNAAVLPESVRAMLGRAPDEMADLARALGVEPDGLPARLRALGGDPPGLAAAGADRERLEDALDAIEERPQLANTPDAPGRDEIRRIIEAAW